MLMLSLRFVALRKLASKRQSASILASILPAARDAVRSDPRRVFLELQLERAARDAEASGGFGHVAVAVRQDTLDVLPLGAREGRRRVGRNRLDRHPAPPLPVHFHE